MVDAFYDRINDYGSVTIKLASPKDITNWSHGEVKKPETINYRTYRPEKDGLFCERIFGPERDWECYCGRYKGMKHKGIVCDRCGVRLAPSKVRRKRMGHINLASPVAHIWFLKATPSRLSTILGTKVASLERVVYFQEYMVVNPKQTSLKKFEILSEEKYKEAVQKYGEDSFEAGMGAETVKKVLQSLNLEEVITDLTKQYHKTSSKQKQKDILKRLKLVKMMKESGNDPSWMILDVIPVIPPELRPLIMLDSGNFATSDLNDLYRRLINRNSRLKKLLDMNAPDVIIKNEKRMLQQSVDALFDNSRCRRPVIGTGSRPLKSLTDMIKGKQGRFRENLLGKRVDYSARSVIVVEPQLKIHQCGLPKKIALELYQPFIIHKLRELGFADNIKSAKKMLEKKDERVWDILEDVIRDHPVLLNRAPTLHRMGIQAFMPILTEGNAIKLHPLVCSGFNADFDGDQMAVHLPLSIEAQVEATTLMLSTNNIFSPANGNPIIAPNQDIVLGCYYLTKEKPGASSEGIPVMSSYDEVFMSFAHGKTKYHTPVWYNLSGKDIIPKPKEENTRVQGRYVRTTIGRIMFNQMLDDCMPFYNCDMDKKMLNKVIAECNHRMDRGATLKLLDDIKALGFMIATLGGISFAKDYMIIPKVKDKVIQETQKEADVQDLALKQGSVTKEERYQRIIEYWTHAREVLGKALMDELANDHGEDGQQFNPLYLMAASGARGSQDQVRQLASMRGLIAKPNGDIIETPIIASFREGLKVLEYFSSTHGARKGLADTALKTADAGYLTRKLADVAQNVVINADDCGTVHGVAKSAVKQGDVIKVTLAENITGRVSCEEIVNRQTGEVVVHANELITSDIAKSIEALGVEVVRVRSALTCESPLGICAKCYGMDLSSGRLVEKGMAVGIIAAQSIGEPGTQLTMRTFHIGGIAVKATEQSTFALPIKGTKVTVNYRDLGLAKISNGDYIVLRQGFLDLHHEESIDVEKGAQLKVAVDVQLKVGTMSEVVAIGKNGKEYKAHIDGTVTEIRGSFDPKTHVTTSKCTIVLVFTDSVKIQRGSIMKKLPNSDKIVEDGMTLPHSMDGVIVAEWDPHSKPILADEAGYVRFIDIIENVTFHYDKKSKVIMDLKGEKHPSIQIINDENPPRVLVNYLLPDKARIEPNIEDSSYITPGTLIAKVPEEITGTQDITGGLPRVTEILEARRPKNPAVISEIDGIVTNLSDKKKGKRTITVFNEQTNTTRDHVVAFGKDIRVNVNDHVKAGDALVDGAKVPQDILKNCGAGPLQEYLLDEIQKVYRSQNVRIDDKHIEIIIAQMMRKVKIDKSGDTEFLPGSIVDKFFFQHVNEEMRTLGKKEATYKPLLLGITKAALQSESFISAASFQETTKVLTEAALSGKKDNLLGLKENVILGHMVPAGTGFKRYVRSSLGVEELIPTETSESEVEASNSEDSETPKE